MISRKKITETILILAIALSNLSQIPALFGNSLIKSGYTIAWILLFMMLLYVCSFKISIKHLILPIIFDVICGIGLIWGQSYFSSALFTPINMSAFILLIGIMMGKLADDETLKRISIVYIATSFIVGLVLLGSVFRGVDWSGSSVYVYGSKNSAAPFLLIGLILVAIIFYRDHKVIPFALIVFYKVLICMMKSRATLISLVIFLLYFIFGVVESKKERNFYIILLMTCVLLIIFQPNVNHLIVDEILLNNRSSDLATLSSGRDYHWYIFKTEFYDYLFMGTGGTYLESMPLAVLMSYGLIGGIPVLLFAIKPLCYAIKERKSKKYQLYTVLVISISLTMLINSIFEEQAPFGPGVKCYFLWLICGLYIGKKKHDNQNV